MTLRCVKHGESSDAWIAGVATLDNLLWVLQPLSETVAVDRRDSMTESLLQEINAGMTEIGTPAEEIETFTAWLQDHLTTLSANDRAYLADDEREELDTIVETLEEVVLTTVPTDPGTLSDITEDVMSKIRDITEGTWVEITSRETPIRCKLATVTQPGLSYIFVNRRGMKVLEKSRGELAALIEAGQLKLIDESQVFDRALQSVIGNLRELQRGQNR